jgi:hypothetical protein
MRWLQIIKRAASQPRTGGYREWKPQLAVEGSYQCVYCAIPDGRFGGEYNFHVEHFEPKSKAPLRRDDWFNLFYACPICNVFKGSDWPTPGGPSAYLDPSTVDYCTVLDVADDGTVTARNSNGAYMVERLYLNRPQLILERREARLLDRLQRARELLDKAVSQIDSPLFSDSEALVSMRAAYAATRRIDGILDKLRTVRPYRTNEVKRPL